MRLEIVGPGSCPQSPASAGEVPVDSREVAAALVRALPTWKDSCSAPMVGGAAPEESTTVMTRVWAVDQEPE